MWAQILYILNIPQQMWNDKWKWPCSLESNKQNQLRQANLPGVVPKVMKHIPRVLISLAPCESMIEVECIENVIVYVSFWLWAEFKLERLLLWMIDWLVFLCIFCCWPKKCPSNSWKTWKATAYNKFLKSYHVHVASLVCEKVLTRCANKLWKVFSYIHPI